VRPQPPAPPSIQNYSDLSQGPARHSRGRLAQSGRRVSQPHATSAVALRASRAVSRTSGSRNKLMSTRGCLIDGARSLPRQA
jgi:hypothetical protein